MELWWHLVKVVSVTRHIVGTRLGIWKRGAMLERMVLLGGQIG